MDQGTGASKFNPLHEVGGTGIFRKNRANLKKNYFLNLKRKDNFSSPNDN